MRRWTNEVIVGASILLAIFIVIFGYIYLREIPVRRSGFEIDIVFKNVTGLEVGDHITVSGLRVGRVQKMTLEDKFVKVRAWLDGSIHFPKDSRAAIRSIGMIGEKYVDLMLGSSAENLHENDRIQGIYIDDLADAGGAMKNLMTETGALLGKLNTVMDSMLARETHLVLSKTIANTERFTQRLDATLARNGGRLEHSLANLDSILQALHSSWRRNESKLDSTLYGLSKGTRHVPEVVARLDSVLKTTNKLLTSIDQQRGAVGKAIYDDSLYVRANEAVEQLNAILAEVKKNPQRYLMLRASLIDLF